MEKSAQVNEAILAIPNMHCTPSKSLSWVPAIKEAIAMGAVGKLSELR